MDLLIIFAGLTLGNVIGFGLIKCQLWSRVFDRVLWQAIALAAVWLSRLISHLGA